MNGIYAERMAIESARGRGKFQCVGTDGSTRSAGCGRPSRSGYSLTNDVTPSKMTVSQLKYRLSTLHLSVKGRKADLIERLEKALKRPSEADTSTASSYNSSEREATEKLEMHNDIAVVHVLPELSALKVSELRDRLKAVGQPVFGRKLDLIQRLVQHMGAREVVMDNGLESEVINRLEEMKLGTRRQRTSGGVETQEVKANSTIEGLNCLTVAQLKTKLKAMDLRTAGLKHELVERLHAHLVSERLKSV